MLHYGPVGDPYKHTEIESEMTMKFLVAGGT